MFNNTIYLNSRLTCPLLCDSTCLMFMLNPEGSFSYNQFIKGW